MQGYEFVLANSRCEPVKSQGVPLVWIIVPSVLVAGAIVYLLVGVKVYLAQKAAEIPPGLYVNTFEKPVIKDQIQARDNV